MKKTAILLIIITMFSKIIGFAREITLSYFYGASSISDAYLIALTIPGVIFGFIGAGIATGYIPMYSKIEKQYGEKEGNIFTNNLINILMIICTIIVIFGLLFTNQIVRIFASGFEGETLALAVQFTKISILGIYFTGLISIFTGFLQIKGNYAIPALIGLPMNFFIVLSIFLSSNTNILVLAIGSVIAVASQLILLLPYIYKEEYRYKSILDIKNKYIKEMVLMVLPVIIGISVNQINILVDRTIASGIVVGGISALNYANKLNGFIEGLFVTSIVTAMYPMISKMVVEDNMYGLKKSVSEAINSINILVVPATVGAMVFADPIVKLLFGRGAFDPLAISMTTSVLFYYSIRMVGYGLGEVICRAFYSLHNTKTPMIIATLAMVLNLILNIILSRYMGIDGLALATSISTIFATCLLLISFRKKIGPFGMRDISISFMKVMVASLTMGAVAKILYNILIGYMNSNLSLLGSIGVGVVVYLVIIYFMRIDEVDSMINMVKRKFKIS